MKPGRKFTADFRARVALKEQRTIAELAGEQDRLRFDLKNMRIRL